MKCGDNVTPLAVSRVSRSLGFQRYAEAKRYSSAVWVPIGIFLLLLESALWTRGVVQVLCGLAAALVVIVANFDVPDRRTRTAGGNIRRSLWILLVAAAMVGFILASGWALGTLHSLVATETPAWQSWIYVPWALVQQWILQMFVYARLRQQLNWGRWAAIVSASLFSLVHLPNWFLVPLTLAAGRMAIHLFRRGVSVYVLGIAHAALGLALAAAFPVTITHYMRVGIAYF
jgi:hypothetical protein